MEQLFGVELPGLIPRLAPCVGDLPDLAAAFEHRGWDEVWGGEHILVGPLMPHPGGAGNKVHRR